MAEDAEIGGNGDGGDDETVKRSPSKKSSGPTGYLTSLHSENSWVFLNSFWPLLKLLIEGPIGKAIKQSSRRATQGAHLNQSLRKLTLHRYNKLSSCQVCGTYELSWYHSTSIIKLRLSGTSTPFEWYILFEPDTLTLSTHLRNAQLCQFYNRFWKKLAGKGLYQTRGHSAYQILLFPRAYLPLHQVGETHSFPQLRWFCDTFLNQANRQRLLPNLRTYQSWDIEVLRC